MSALLHQDFPASLYSGSDSVKYMYYTAAGYHRNPDVNEGNAMKAEEAYLIIFLSFLLLLFSFRLRLPFSQRALHLLIRLLHLVVLFRELFPQNQAKKHLFIYYLSSSYTLQKLFMFGVIYFYHGRQSFFKSDKHKQ